ncbi:MAG: DUF5916 domain-containing protein [Planctomycetota bacterium]|nr:DUF5916 domain-containing protein [Planctomycetota bacterium]
MLALFLFAATLAPQGQDVAPLFQEDRRMAQIGRIDAADAPNFDGSLDDPCWAQAPEVGRLITVEPRLGADPDQRTVVKILHDRHNLYMAVWCFDDNPSGIRATQRSRDASLDPDDRVEFILDPFNSRRNAYWFQIGAGGSCGDALLGGSHFEKSWDAIWDGRAKITSRGWQAEIRIPFRSLAFPEGGRVWGFNLRRHRRQANSEYRFTNIVLGRRFFRVADIGLLDGFGEIDTGIGLDVVPYAVGDMDRRRELSFANDPTGRDWNSNGDAGLDMFYRLTPSMTFSMTFNTDFAETESDARKINLTRFPLFFPEKRDFFLEDASRFQFGAGSRRETTFVPFFSRRIGLDSKGNKIPIISGVKVAGEAGPWEVGFLSILQDESADVGSERNLSVARVKRALADETAIGMIGTIGRPLDRGSNSIYGVDFYHREKRFIGDSDLRFWANVVGSHTSGGDGKKDGNGMMGDVRLRGEANEWRWHLGSRWVSDDFNPELGFIRRKGIKQFDQGTMWLPRPDTGPIRNWELGVRTRAVTDEANEVEDLDFRLDPGIEFHSGDEIGMTFSRRFERVDKDFKVFNEQFEIPMADYWETRADLRFESSEGRPLSGEVSLSAGDRYAGSSERIGLDLAWRPSPLLTVGAELDWERVRLPNARFVARVLEGRLDLEFTPRVTLHNLLQYDNESRNLGFQSRLRWVLEPGSDLFVVVSGGWLDYLDGGMYPHSQDLAIKLVHTFRF